MRHLVSAAERLLATEDMKEQQFQAPAESEPDTLLRHLAHHCAQLELPDGEEAHPCVEPLASLICGEGPASAHDPACLYVVGTGTNVVHAFATDAFSHPISDPLNGRLHGQTYTFQLPNGAQVRTQVLRRVPLQTFWDQHVNRAVDSDLDSGTPVSAAQQPFAVLDLRIECSNEEVYKALSHFLAAAEWCSQVGHSTKVAVFIDGDGSDHLRIQGLDPALQKVGADMAQAASSYGDGLMTEVGATVARAYNTRYVNDHEDRQELTVHTVYPESDSK